MVNQLWSNATVEGMDVVDGPGNRSGHEIAHVSVYKSREFQCVETDVVQGRIHFHPKSISSNDTFIQKRFHPMTHSSKTLSSTFDTFIQNTLIQQQFHPMNFSSNDIFIQ